jgi:DNA invertase Pin-like site-specific DNA recombinase
LLRKYAGENGISIVQEYVDVETAKAAGRTGFNQMVEFFAAGQDQGPGSAL